MTPPLQDRMPTRTLKGLWYMTSESLRLADHKNGLKYYTLGRKGSSEDPFRIGYISDNSMIIDQV